MYNTIELVRFFGIEKYNWLCTLTFRIAFVLHDFGYFITYAVAAAVAIGISGDYEDQCQQGNDDYCRRAVSGPFTIATCVLFVVTTAIGVAILIAYSQFPKHGGSCCESQSPVMMLNGPIIPMQTVATSGPNQQLYMITNQDGQTNPSLVLTQQPPVVNQVREQSFTPQATVCEDTKEPTSL